MAFFWIIAGVVYVLYKLHKEEKIFTKTALILLGVVFVWILVTGLIPYYIWGETVATIVSAITFGLPMLCIAICGIVFSIPKEPKAKTINLGSEPQIIAENLKKEFQNNGYNIKDEHIRYIIQHPISPIKHQNATVKWCYDWLCEQKTIEIDRLSREQLEALLGVSLKDMPLDKSLPTGEASLKRTLTAKQYILKKDGLLYRTLGGGTYTSSLYSLYLNDEKYYLDFKKNIEDRFGEHH